MYNKVITLIYLTVNNTKYLEFVGKCLHYIIMSTVKIVFEITVNIIYVVYLLVSNFNFLIIKCV